MGGLGRTIMEGMAFGTGSAIAHRAVGAVAGSMFGGAAPAPAEGAAAPEAAAAAAAPSRGQQDCAPFMRDFSACVAEHRDDIAQCQMYSDSFTACQQQARLH